MRYLTLEEMLRLHFQTIEEFGGTHGIRDEARVKAVLEASARDIHEQAALYVRKIVVGRPFLDGNKRTGVTVAGVFLLLNGIMLTATPAELRAYIDEIYHRHLGVTTIAGWLREHSGPHKRSHRL